MATLATEIVQSSLARIQSFFARFQTAFVPTVEAEAEVAALAVAERLNENVKKQFIAGTDKYGESHNKTGDALGSFHVQEHPLGAYIIANGAAFLTEVGTVPHVILARNSPLLVFETHDGALHFTPSVNHPGAKADDYVGRAIEETDLEPFMASLVSRSYDKLFARLGLPSQ